MYSPLTFTYDKSTRLLKRFQTFVCFMSGKRIRENQSFIQFFQQNDNKEKHALGDLKECDSSSYRIALLFYIHPLANFKAFFTFGIHQIEAENEG